MKCGFKIMNGSSRSGIVLNGVKFAQIYENYCSNHHYGMELVRSHNNMIENNKIIGNRYGGILVQASNFNIINNKPNIDL